MVKIPFLANLFLLLPAFAFAENDCVQASRLFREGVNLSDGSAKEEEYYRQAVSLCPTMAEAYYNLGVLFSRQGKRDEALKSYQQALAIGPKAEFHTALGNLKVAAQDFEGARKFYESALELNPVFGQALQGLSIVYDHLGLYEKEGSSVAVATDLEKVKSS